jgi:hypothetical protein
MPVRANVDEEDADHIRDVSENEQPAGLIVRPATLEEERSTGAGVGPAPVG